jgi:two-component system, sensor histidine kinase and response regulator
MPQKRAEVHLVIVRAKADLDRALERLEALSDDDRERFSYSVHALNNYLMVVATTIQLIRTKLVPRGDRDVRLWLDSLKHSTSLMMSTARGVLTATPDALPPLLFEPASLAEISGGVCSAYREIARNKQVRITCRGSAKPDRILTDRVAAGAVLDNLLSNAVKYSEAGSAVSVTVTVQGDQVVCSVRDDGPGLSESDQGKLFQRGVRLSAQPTAGESSSGYGLAIAHDLAIALGGQLSCSSVPGSGSCFTFSLPLAPGGGEADSN